MTFAEAWNAAFPQNMWILLVVAAVMCSIGYIKFVYFLSIGYGLAILGAGVTILCMFGFDMPLGILLQCILFILYGIRLGGFLLIRELKSSSYRKTLTSATKSEKPMPIFVKFFIWVCVAALYVMQVSPVYYRLVNFTQNGLFPSSIIEDATITYICFAISFVGLLIETIADIQKNAAKKINPKRFCDIGLYKMVRCPNYFGEILFWSGVFISGFGALKGGFQWAINIIAYVSIVFIMFDGAKRLELRQNKNYGKMADYQKYVAKTPIIIPLVPLYHLASENK